MFEMEVSANTAALREVEPALDETELRELARDQAREIPVRRNRESLF